MESKRCAGDSDQQLTRGKDEFASRFSWLNVIRSGKSLTDIEGGDQWNEGQKLVKKGEKLRSRSARQIKDGQINLEKAEKQIAKGRELMAANEELFHATYSVRQD